MKKLLTFLFAIPSILSAQTLDIYGPKPFNEILEQDFNPSWTPAPISGISNLSHIILLNADATTNTVQLDDSDITNIVVGATDDINGSGATYNSAMHSMFQIVDVNSNTDDELADKHIIHPLLHSYHALTESAGNIINNDAGSYYVKDASASSYLVFEFGGTASSTKFSATGQYIYNSSNGDFENNASWTTQWLMIDASQLVLTGVSDEASNFYLADPLDLIDFSLAVGLDFNPSNTEWQDNEFAAYPDGVWDYDESSLYSDQFFNDVDDIPQVVQVKGNFSKEPIQFTGLQTGLYILKGEGANISFEQKVVVE